MQPMTMSERVLAFAHRFDTEAILRRPVKGYENQHSTAAHLGDFSTTVIVTGFDDGGTLSVLILHDGNDDVVNIGGARDDDLLETLVRQALDHKNQQAAA